MPQLFHFVAEQFKESLMLGGQSQQHMVAGRLCQYLKPWQLEGLRFLYKNHEKGEASILNDESGLGKVVTVATFLGSILTNDTTKKCLIVVRDEQAIEEWRFHLSVLTHLTVKVIEKTTDINFETVFLIKWSTLKNISEIDKVNFNHIILDNRGDMLNNKFCTGILLRYFENKTTIIISSTDVTSDIKLLHILLRLCGRLERQFVDVKVFENKFQLPQLQEGVSNKVDLEDYFLKRERVINFCREFRLRRYCHQFDEDFPIVSRNEFQRHLEQWQMQNKNSLSSGSVKLLSSSSEKDTEELFKEYFQVKQERDICRLDEEVERINEMSHRMDNEDEANISDDVVVMSPLVLASESESDDDQTQMQNERNSQFIEEIKDTEDEIRDKGMKTTKASEDNSKRSRRKPEKPVKTPSNSNGIKMQLDDRKSLRSRTLTSPKKPLPISTKSRKSLETEKLKGDSVVKITKDKETERRLRNQENMKKSFQNEEEKKTKASKERDNMKLKENDDKKTDKGTTSLTSKKKEEHTNISNGQIPEKSSKKKQNEAEGVVKLAKSKTLQETPKSTRSVRIKIRSDEDKRDDNKEKTKTPSNQDTTVRSDKEIQKTADDQKNISPVGDKHKKIVDKESKKDENSGKVSSRVKSKLILMLEEAQKFVRNENIGRRSTNSKKTNRRAKILKVPEINITTNEDSESSSHSVWTPKKHQIPTETTKQALNNTKNRHKLTELKPVGVHSISTRGMQRHTRSNPVASKYMRVAIEQVGIEKRTSTRRNSRRRKSVVLVKRVSPKTKPAKPPSPTPSVISDSDSPSESIPLGQVLTPTNTFAVPDFVAPAAPKNSDYNFPLMLDRETSDSECQIASQISNNQEVIVLTGSSTNDREMEPPKSTVSRRKTAAKPPMVTIHRPFFDKAKSPDLFSTCSDLSLPCSQQNTNKSHFEGFKIFGSELRQPPKPRSCLDILERMLEPRSGIIAGKKTTPATQEKPKISNHQHCVEDEDAMFEITANGTFGNTVRINSMGEMSPIRNKSQSTPPTSGHPKNRITNYLISNSQHTNILAQPSPSSLDDLTDLLPKTPKRRKSMCGNVKRSPRSLATGATGGSGKSQSTKLTQWLVKNSNSDMKNTDSLMKPQSTKRRRLELSFPDK